METSPDRSMERLLCQASTTAHHRCTKGNPFLPKWYQDLYKILFLAHLWCWQESSEWQHFPKACKWICCAHTVSLTQIPFQDQDSGSSAGFCLGGVKGEHPALHDCSNFTADISWQLEGKVRVQCPAAGQEQWFLMMLSHSWWLGNQSEFVSLQTALPIRHHKYLQLGTSQAVTHGKHHPIPKTEALEFN